MHGSPAGRQLGPGCHDWPAKSQALNRRTAPGRSSGTQPTIRPPSTAKNLMHYGDGDAARHPGMEVRHVGLGVRAGQVRGLRRANPRDARRVPALRAREDAGERGGGSDVAG